MMFTNPMRSLEKGGMAKVYNTQTIEIKQAVQYPIESLIAHLNLY